MAKAICCICHTPIEGPVKMFGGRTYCERHYDKLVKHRGHIWTDTAVLVLGLVLFVLAVTLLAPVLQPILQGDGLLIAGAILALAPAALWLAVFYTRTAWSQSRRSTCSACLCSARCWRARSASPSSMASSG